MATIGRLGVKIDADTGGLSLGLRDATQKVDAFEGRVSKMSETMAFASKAAGALGAIIAGAGLAGQIIAVQRQFDVLNASLITVTGSTQNAAGAFEWIQKFAATTPYQLEEVTGAFIKMKAMGLNASEDALRSYGNTASAMGKGLDQMIEAVADAATGEFERLKEFGIKSKKEGDNVTFTFRGVETTIRASSDNIVSYLRRIGDEDFASAMNERVKTLDGSVSNLADSYNKLLLTISQGGFGQTVSREIGILSNDFTALSDAMQASAKKGDGAFMQLANGAGLVAGRTTFGALQSAANLTNSAINLLTGGVFDLNENVNLMPVNLLPAAAQMEIMTSRLKQAKVEYDVLASRLADAPDNIYIKSEINQLGLYIEKLEEATKQQRLMQGAMASIEGMDFSSESAKFMRQQKVPVAPPPAPVVTPKPTGGGGDADKAADDAMKKAQEVEAFFAQIGEKTRQREIDGLTTFMDGLKTREEARLQSGMNEQALAEQAYQTEYDRLIEAKELLALTEEEFTERMLQIRMDRDTRIMDADMAMLDREQQLADERVRINQQAEKMILDAKSNATQAAIGLLNALGGKSKGAAIAAIALGKAVSIAQAIQNTAVGVTKALTIDPTGALASRVAMMGKVQIGLIAATGLVQAGSVGGGSSVSLPSSVSSSSQSGASGGASAPSMSQTITIQGVSSGDLFSGDAVRTLIDKLIDAQRNGARIVLA